MKNKIEPLGMDDSGVATRLIEKTYSPMIVRKYQIKGWPLFVSMICDLSLSDLDEFVSEIIDKCDKEGMFINDIQSSRNICGYLNEKIVEHYNNIKKGSVEGVYILMEQDKIMIASAFGDFMVHNKCLNEVIGILQIMPHV